MAQKKYLEWAKAGGPNECIHGYAQGIPCPDCDRLERLATYAHTAWSGWMDYMFSRSELHADGSVTIPPGLVERWKRQANTEFLDLPEPEKESDFVEAQRMLDAMRQPQQPTEGE